MKKQSLNFLWLNLEFPARKNPSEDSIYEPIPSKYIENVRNSARLNSEAETSLWVDSKRLTSLQYSWLKANVNPAKLQDLRSIPEYANEPLYNHGETETYWRDASKNSIIWRQVDAAKILVALQGNYEQSFFLDLDYSHININSNEVQKRMNDYNFLIGQRTYKPVVIGSKLQGNEGIIENQFFGITPKSKDFFSKLYNNTLKEAYNGKNGWKLFKTKFNAIITALNIPQDTVAYDVKPDGSHAYHPGDKNPDGDEYLFDFERNAGNSRIKIEKTSYTI